MHFHSKPQRLNYITRFGFCWHENMKMWKKGRKSIQNRFFIFNQQKERIKTIANVQSNTIHSKYQRKVLFTSVTQQQTCSIMKSSSLCMILWNVRMLAACSLSVCFILGIRIIKCSSSHSLMGKLIMCVLEFVLLLNNGDEEQWENERNAKSEENAELYICMY